MHYDEFSSTTTPPPMTGITIDRRDEQLIAVKGSTVAGADRRYREAQLLARLDHPGVVQFVELIDGESVELHMQYAGADTWESLPPATPDGIVNGLAAVASTVADLHELGTTHRALVPDHVIVTADHRPVLCGLSDACAADPIAIADDLAGMAGLIRHLSPGAPDPLRRSLAALAIRAESTELSARNLVTELNELRGPGQSTSPGPRRVVTFVAGGAVLLAIVGTAWMTTRRSNPVSPSAIEAREEAGAIVAGASTPPPSAPPINDIVPAEPPAAMAGALELNHDGRRYGVGAPGDLAILGDWNCDGVSTPALLQPTTGLVAVFLSWPDTDSSALPGQSAFFPQASDLVAVEVNDCHQLRVIGPTGSQLFVAEAS